MKRKTREEEEEVEDFLRRMKEAIRRKGVEKREVAMSEPTAKRRKRGESGGSGR